MGLRGPSDWLLAVDFGTSNTAAASLDTATGEVRSVALSHTATVMSSSVFVTSPTQIEVGDVARDRATSDPSSFVVAPKRSLAQAQQVFRVGDGDVPAHSVVAAILRSAMIRSQSQLGGRSPSGIVLTHPEGWSPQQIRVLTEAANEIGYPSNLVQTVSEPQAAAHHYGRTTQVRPGERIAVFDFGGGTLDVAVLTARSDGSFEVTAARGDQALGGRDFDAAIRRWVEHQLGESNPELVRRLATMSLLDRRALDESIRQAKELLSETPSAGIDVRVGEHHERLSLTRREFEEIIAPDVARAVQLTRGTLELAGIRGPGRLQAIYLTGGSSRIPLIHTQLQAFAPVATLDDPKTVVARGALACVYARNRPAPPSGPPTIRISQPTPQTRPTPPAEPRPRTVPVETRSHQTPAVETRSQGMPYVPAEPVRKRPRRRKILWAAAALVVVAAVATALGVLRFHFVVGGNPLAPPAANLLTAPTADTPIADVIAWVNAGNPVDLTTFHTAKHGNATTNLHDDIAFSSPSNKLSCITDSAHGNDGLVCKATLKTWPDRPKQGGGDWEPGWVAYSGSNLTVGEIRSDQGPFTAGDGLVLPYGSKITFDNYSCRLDLTGLTCVNTQVNSGVTMSDAGIVPHGCLQPRTKTADEANIGKTYGCS